MLLSSSAARYIVWVVEVTGEQGDVALDDVKYQSACEGGKVSGRS